MKTPRSFEFYGLEILSVEKSAKSVPAMLANAVQTVELGPCPNCGSTDVYRRGLRHITLQDAPHEGRRVKVRVQVQNVRCRACKRVHSPPRPFACTPYHYTPRLRDWVLDRAGEKRMHLVAATGLDEQTIRKILERAKDSPIMNQFPAMPA